MSEKANIHLDQAIVWGRPVRRRRWWLVHVLAFTSVFTFFFHFKPFEGSFHAFSPASREPILPAQDQRAGAANPDPFAWPNVSQSHISARVCWKHAFRTIYRKTNTLRSAVDAASSIRATTKQVVAARPIDLQLCSVIWWARYCGNATSSLLCHTRL